MSSNDTDIDDDVDIAEAQPLPPLDEAEKEAVPSPLPVPEDEGNPKVDDGQEDAEPPALPPLLELAGSNLATTGGLAYGAVGPAGLLVVGAVATVGAVACMARGSRKRAEQRARAGAGGAGAGQGRRGGRFRGLLSGAGAGRGPGGGSRGLAGRGRGGGAPGLAGRGRGGAGALGRGRAGSGAVSGGLGRRGAGAGAGRGRFGALGSRGGARAGAGRSGGGLRGFGSAGSGRSGKSSPRWGGSGISGASRGGSRGRSGGFGTRGFGGGSSGSLFGAGRGSSGRRGSRGLFGAATKRARGRTTSISDPAMPVGTGRRPLRGAFRAARRGWSHPRVRRGRVRFKRASVRTRDYMRKRIRRMKARAFWQALAGWWGRLWGRVRGDDRYGPMSSATATAVALSVALLGPGRRTSTPRRPLTGRIIGTSARTPGEISGRDRRAISAGGTSGTTTDLEGHVMKKPGEIIRAEAAANEMRAALAAFGSADVHMLTYMGGLDTLPGILRTFASGLHTMSSSAESEQPLHPAVTQYMHQIAAAVHQVASVADELPGLFRAAHETELDLLNNNKPNAERWDRSRRDD